MARWMRIGGLPIRDTSSDILIRYIEGRTEKSTQLAVGFVNHNFVVACRDLEVGDPKGILLLNDGIGMQAAAMLTQRRGFCENMNGTDFVPLVLRRVRQPLTVYLLGGTTEVVAKAAAHIDAMANRRVVGYVDGFSIWAREADIIRDINEARPDILLVGFGNPRQERWILEHRHELAAKMIFAVGALFEWMTGTRRRAPMFIRRARLEWLYRLGLEPRRLAKRYTYDVVRFFWIVWRHR